MTIGRRIHDSTTLILSDALGSHGTYRYVKVTQEKRQIIGTVPEYFGGSFPPQRAQQRQESAQFVEGFIFRRVVEIISLAIREKQ